MRSWNSRVSGAGRAKSRKLPGKRASLKQWVSGWVRGPVWGNKVESAKDTLWPLTSAMWVHIHAHTWEHTSRKTKGLLTNISMLMGYARNRTCGFIIWWSLLQSSILRTFKYVVGLRALSLGITHSPWTRWWPVKRPWGRSPINYYMISCPPFSGVSVSLSS